MPKPKHKEKKKKGELKPLSSKQLKPMFKYMEEHFGVTLKGQYAFFISSKNNVYGMTRDVADLPLADLRINTIGCYMWEWHRDEVRFSIEGTQIVGPHATKNVIELNKGLYTLWVAGYDLEYKHDPGYVIIKYENDYLGCARSNGEKLLNYVPKSRRYVQD